MTAVMRPLYQSVLVNKKLSRKAKLSIYWSILIPTLTYGQVLWVVTQRMLFKNTSGQNGFLYREAGQTLRDGERSSVTWEELRLEPLLLHI